MLYCTRSYEQNTARLSEILFLSGTTEAVKNVATGALAQTAADDTTTGIDCVGGRHPSRLELVDPRRRTTAAAETVLPCDDSEKRSGVRTRFT